MNPRITRHPHGIFAVDAEYVRPGHAAAHIIQQGSRAAFVDIGTNYSVPYLLAALEHLGISRDAVDYVFLTHIHLDHAGGAGLLMKALPNARLFVHPRGAPHLIDPTALIEGTRVVYGDENFRRLYGDIVPVAAERVALVQDGDRHSLAGRELELIHTPGHALHHYAIVDRAHSSIFTGDTFGVSYRELDTTHGAFITPATTPTHFDPDQLIASIDRLLTYRPESMYLMHYSRVTGVPRLAESLKHQIREIVRIARESAGSPDPHAAIRERMKQLWLGLLQQHGCRLTETEQMRVLEGDLELNTQGLVVWLARSQKKSARP